MTKPPALIVGGGIGGLTAALCLASHGIESEVFEQSPDFSEIGAGIQLSPNCTRVLDRLGFLSELSELSFLPQAAEIRDWRSGQVLSVTSLVGGSYPYLNIHRADLMSILVAESKKVPLIRLHTGVRISAIRQTAEEVQIVVNNKSISGSLLIGADGIHSMVREKFYGQDRSRFTGNIAWRAMIPADRLPRSVPPVAGVWWGPGKHFVHYYVRGGTMVNCVCVVEKAGWLVESWTERGEREELKRDFAGWHENVQMLIDHMEPDGCYKWALFDREPMKQWSRGKVTLLGDACHPTLPFLAQGAAMAIEDAAVLAECVSNGPDDIGAALKRYEHLRSSRTARIQKGSRRNAKIFHMGGVQAWVRNRTLLMDPAKRIMQGIYDFDVYDMKN